MADLPDYYTQAQISEAEAASFKGGLEANIPDHPLSRDVYLATDTQKLYYCIVDDEWADVTHACLLLAGGTMAGDIVMNGHKVNALANPTELFDATHKKYVDDLVALYLLLTGGTLTGNLTIEKDVPVLTLKATEENGQEWTFEEFVYGGESWVKIENKVTDKAFFIARDGSVEARQRVVISASPVGGEDGPYIWLEDVDGGASQWYIQNLTPDLKFWSVAGEKVRFPSIRPESDNTYSSGASDKRWKEICAFRHSITQAIGTDHRWSGITAPMTAGTALTIGQAVYVGGDSKMEKALATTAATMPAIALATGSIDENASGEFLLQGFFRDDTWDWTPGGLLYVSEDTAGALTQELPAASGEQVQVVGVAITADIIHFNPSYELVEIS